MLSSTRPAERRCRVAAIWATSVGEASPGRSAIMNFSRSVCAANADATTHGSSQNSPAGVSTLVNPSRSAARAT